MTDCADESSVSDGRFLLYDSNQIYCYDMRKDEKNSSVP